jgi:putative NADH-flavin reductase
MSIFLLGANGTLGIQLALIAKKKKNYSVTCLVRRFTPEMDYLSYYGIRVLYGNMLNSTVLLESIFGSNVVIDATTSRNFEKIEESDLKAKLRLIKVVENLKIEHFIFFSFVNAEKFSTIPLVKSKLFI